MELIISAHMSPLLGVQGLGFTCKKQLAFQPAENLKGVDSCSRVATLMLFLNTACPENPGQRDDLNKSDGLCVSIFKKKPEPIQINGYLLGPNLDRCFYPKPA